MHQELPIKQDNNSEWLGSSLPRAFGVALLGGSLLFSGCSKQQVEHLDTIPVSEILSNPARFKGQHVAIEGTPSLIADRSSALPQPSHFDVYQNATFTIRDKNADVIRAFQNRNFCQNAGSASEAISQLLLKEGQPYKIGGTIGQLKGSTNWFLLVHDFIPLPREK